MTPQELYQRALAWFYPREKMQVQKRQARYTYVEGPMLFLGQQIIKAMEDAGYPARISEHYRSPAKQLEVMANGFSRAGAWESAHQFYEAVDIIHPSLGWNVTADYWEALSASVSAVESRYGVQLTHGHNWRWRDSAHIELSDWKTVKNAMADTWHAEWRDRKDRQQSVREFRRPPNRDEMAKRFKEVLPDVWSNRPTK